jgi:hypothetical protein
MSVRLAVTTQGFLGRYLALPGPSATTDRGCSVIGGVAILGAWLSMVVFTAIRHEFWRDEVRALSLARAAALPWDLPALIQHEGHPLLWFLLLYVGKAIIDTSLVLPVVSILIAFAAAAVFLFRAPFPFWMRCLFLFGFPVYEYSVMARNYGISMLFLFLFAVLYRERDGHPWRLGVILALLANTNVHSAILASLLAAVWAWDAHREGQAESRRAFYLAMPTVCAGLLLCAIVIAPRQENSLPSLRRAVTVRQVAESVVDAGFMPGHAFVRIVPGTFPSVVASVVLLLSVGGLLPRPALLGAALAAQVGFGVLFSVIERGGYRHQGLFLVFIVCLYWLLLDTARRTIVPRAQRGLFKAGACDLAFLLLSNVVITTKAAWADVRFERSSVRALGAFLERSPAYRDAILVAEPDYLLEALPYYAENRMYLPRENRFGTTVSWTTATKAELSLGELLASARRLRAIDARPILMVLGHGDVAESHPHGEIRYSYGRTFSWSEDELADFSRSTSRIVAFNAAYTDENFRVYELK